MKAKAAVFMGANKPFEIKEFDLVPPKPGYAKMSLIASGVCGTDLHIHNGKLGGTPNTMIGHEFVGRIEEIADADAEKWGLKVGDAVISDIAVPCGECLLCKSGDDANCVNMKVTSAGTVDVEPHFHGGYGEYSYAPAENLIKIPDDVDPKMAAVCACPGPTTLHSFALAAHAGVDICDVKTAVVQGFGPVGAFGVAYLSAMGVENVILVSGGLGEEKQTLAENLGATHIFSIKNDGEEKIKAEIASLTGGLGADLVFEASGNPAAIPFGMEILRNRGAYLVPGQYSDSGAIEIRPEMITFKALHIIGSSQYSFCDVRAYVDFLSANPLLHDAIASLATCYSISDVNKAFEDAKARKNVKTVLV